MPQLAGQGGLETRLSASQGCDCKALTGLKSPHARSTVVTVRLSHCSHPDVSTGLFHCRICNVLTAYSSVLPPSMCAFFGWSSHSFLSSLPPDPSHRDLTDSPCAGQHGCSSHSLLSFPLVFSAADSICEHLVKSSNPSTSITLTSHPDNLLRQNKPSSELKSVPVLQDSATHPSE